MRRNNFRDEQEAVDLAKTFLESPIRRLFEATAVTRTITFTLYTGWLNTVFRDANEQMKQRNEWARLEQGNMSIMDFVSYIVRLGARIVPAKTYSEMKEAFRINMHSRI